MNPRFRVGSPKSRSRRPVRGTAVVEFVLCLPVLLLMTMLTIEACNLIQLKHSLAVAAYEGARTATIKGAKAGDVENAARQVMTDRRVSDGDVKLTPKNLQDVAVGEYITVTTWAQSKKNAVFQGLFDTKVQETATMMKEY